MQAWARLLFEVFTSLAAAQLVCDVLVHGRSVRAAATSRAAAAVLALQLCSAVLAHFSVADAQRVAHALLSDDIVGAAAAVPLPATLAAGVTYGCQLNRSSQLGRRRAPRALTLAIFAALAVGCAHIMMSSGYLPFKTSFSLSRRTALRLHLLALLHTIACYTDCASAAAAADGGAPRRCSSECRRRCLSVRFGAHFVRCLACSLAYVAPAYPLLLLGASATLALAASSAGHAMGVRLAAVRWLADWGALHAPFWLVHARTRQLAVSGDATLRGARGSGSGDALLPLTRRDVAGRRVARLGDGI